MKKNRKKYRKKDDFLVVEDGMETRIYFDPKKFSISEHEVEMAVYLSVYGGYCTGAWLCRLAYGEIRLYFNPLCQGKKARKEVIDRMINVIDSQSIDITEEDD